MGYEYFKRPLRVLGSTNDVRGAADIAGNLTLSADLVLPVESVTAVAAAQTLSDHGVSFVTYGTSGGARDILLPAPIPGAVKHIFVVNNTTSVELKIFTNATANTFWGTTWNQVAISAASTGSPGGTPAGSAYLGLVGASTTQWAIYPGSTFNWDFSGSTGSTAQA